VASLVAPEIFTSRKARVDVECAGKFSTGATVVSFARGESLGGAAGRVPPEEANVDVLFDVDREAFVSLIRDALEVLD
jgi:inosine-uridine nucleoside N-ribohydrolase